jgi:hypothetical protein
MSSFINENRCFVVSLLAMTSEGVSLRGSKPFAISPKQSLRAPPILSLRARSAWKSQFKTAMEPHGQARGPQEPYPPTPRLLPAKELVRRAGRWVIRR